MTLALQLGIIQRAQMRWLLKQCADTAIEFLNSMFLLSHKYGLISKCVLFSFCKVTVCDEPDNKTIIFLAKEVPFFEITCKCTG